MMGDPYFSRAQARVGSLVKDKWRLDALLGVGGMASVYAATHRNGIRAAVKMLHPEMATNELARERFLREGYVANAVRHDGVVKVFDDDRDEDGSLYLVTELLIGETLEERRLRLGGRIAQDECLLVIDQLLEVLSVAHAASIVHRDVKPDNLFLTQAGQVKLLDFGIAKVRQSVPDKGATQQGLLLGSPGYMPPEQALGLSDEVDERSDIWACGATMYCLLSGQMVHAGGTVTEHLVEATTKPAPPLGAAAPDIDLSVAQFVDCALEFSKSERWPSAASMREALHQVYETLYGRPIETAPRLALGEGAKDRTALQGSGGRPTLQRKPAPTPASDMSSYRPLAHSVVSQTKRGLVGVRAAIGFGLVAAGFVSVMALGHRRPPVPREAVAGTSTVVAARPRSSSVAQSAPPEVFVTDLPVARTPPSEEPPTEPRETPATPGLASPPRERSAAPNCRPPYVVDPETEKKHWKIECL